MSVKKQVEVIISNSTEAKDFDKRLLLDWWKSQGLKLNRKQESVFLRIAAPSSVMRVRRELLSKYPVSKNVVRGNLDGFASKRLENKPVKKLFGRVKLG